MLLIVLENAVNDHEDVEDGPLVLHILKLCSTQGKRLKRTFSKCSAQHISNGKHFLKTQNVLLNTYQTASTFSKIIMFCSKQRKRLKRPNLKCSAQHISNGLKALSQKSKCSAQNKANGLKAHSQNMLTPLKKGLNAVQTQLR